MSTTRPRPTDPRPPLLLGPCGQIVTTRDVVYGEAPVGHPDATHPRPLAMDVYAPVEEPSSPPGPHRPALLLAHGGAYHRGSKDVDEFEQGGHANTPVAEWCRRFAARGFVCFSVGYRLTQEQPPPRPEAIKRERHLPAGHRMGVIRSLLGLPPASDADLIDGQEAAFADVATACRYVSDHADRWRIDPSRIAIGGFSAGASSSAYAAYALGAPAAALVSLSGSMVPADAAHYLAPDARQRLVTAPPALLIASEHDLPGIAESSGFLAAQLQAAGIGHRYYRVPDMPHFYPAEAEVRLAAANLPGAPLGGSLEEAVRAFLYTALDLQGAAPDLQRCAAPSDASSSRAPDAAMLQAFADAWNRHDLDGLMRFMSDDCEFRAWTGPDTCGIRYQGPEAVRAGFARAWADVPDAQWTRARHFVQGDRGVSEWTFVGTRSTDGRRIEVDGCDLFTFSGGRIRVKDSWRKLRT